jgi:hypothetical protein
LGGLLQGLVFEAISRHSLAPEDESWESLTELFFAEELLHRPEVDRLARHAARHFQLPAQISPAARYYFCFRLQCAMDFLGMVCPPQAEDSPFPDLSPDWTDERAAEWLLVDLWLRRHDHWLKLNAIGIRGPFPFYGLEPADPNIPE